MAFGRKPKVVAGAGKSGLGPKPVVLPSERKENAGQDPNVALVPKRGVWGALGGSKAPQEEASSTAVEGTVTEAGHSGTAAVHSAPKPSQAAATGPAWGGAGLPARIQEQAEIAKDVPDDPKSHPDTQYYMYGAQFENHGDGYHGRPYDGEFSGPPHLHADSIAHFAGPPNMPPSALAMAPPPPRNGDFNGGVDPSKFTSQPRQAQHGGNQRRDMPLSASKHPGFSPEGNFSAKVAMSGRGSGGRHARRSGPDVRSNGPGRGHQHAAHTHRSTSQASCPAADTPESTSPSADVQPAHQCAGVEDVERFAEHAIAQAVSAGRTASATRTPFEGIHPAPGPTADQLSRPDVNSTQRSRAPQQPAAPVHARHPLAGPSPPGSVPVMAAPVVDAVLSQPVQQSVHAVPVTAVPIQGAPDTGGVPLVANIHPHTAGMPMSMHIPPGTMVQHVPSASGPQVAHMHNMYPAQSGAPLQVPPHIQRHAVQVIPHNHPVAVCPVAVQQRHPGPHMEQARPQPPPPTAHAARHHNALPVEPGRGAHSAVATAEGGPAAEHVVKGKHHAQRGSRSAGHDNASVAVASKDDTCGSSQSGEGQADTRGSDGHMRGRGGHNGARGSASRQDAGMQAERRSRGAGEKQERQQASHIAGSGQRGNDGPPDTTGRGGEGRGRGGEGRGRREVGRGRGTGRGTGERDSGDGAKHRGDWDNDHGRSNAGAVEGPAGDGRGHLRGRGRRHDAAELCTGAAENFRSGGGTHTGRGAHPGRGRGQGHSSGRGRFNGRGDAAGRSAAVDGCEGGRNSAQHAQDAAGAAKAGRGSGEQGRGAGRVQGSRGGRHSQVGESVNVESAAAAAKAAAEAASVSVDIAPQVFTQALAKLEAFNIQETPKIPVPSSSHRPVRESKGRRGVGKGRINLDMKEKLKDANDASS